jgi:hypothetical protein
MRKLIQNKWQTPDGTILISKHRHDYVEYTDKNGDYYMIDGGNDYVRKSVNKKEMKNLCIYSDGSFETDRFLLWGVNYDKNMKRLPKTEFVPIKDLNTDHIWAILLTLPNMNKEYRKVMEEEILFREEEWYNNN